MNIFQLYIGQIHLISLVSVCAVLLLALYRTRKYLIHIRIVLSLLTVVLGHFVYEDIFIGIMGLTGRDTGAWKLFILTTIIIILMMYTMQNLYRFLSLRDSIFSIFLGTLLIFLFLSLWMSGWFHALQLWYTGLGPDPHDMFWAISKIIGFLLFVPLLKEDR